MNKFCRFLADERGATAIEYGLIVSLIVIVVAASFPSMGGWVQEMITATSEGFSSS